MYIGRDRMNLTDELDLCDDGNILSNKDKLLKMIEFLGVESKTCNEIPNKGWNMTDREMEGRRIVRSNQTFKEFSDKLLTSYVQIIQLFTNIMMYKERGKERNTSHSCNSYCQIIRIQ